MMLKYVGYLLLGAIAGLLAGMIPCFIVFIFSNGTYAAGVLTSCTLAGAVMGMLLGKRIKLFFDGLIEFITSEAWS